MSSEQSSASGESTVITKMYTYFNFAFTDYVKAGFGLALGVLVAIGVAAFVVDKFKCFIQLLGIEL